MKSLALSLVLGLCALPAQVKKAVPAADASKLRAQYAEALAKDDEKARAQLLATGKKLAGKHDFDSLVAALRQGPLLEQGDKGMPKPRKSGKQVEQLSTFGTTTVGYRFTCAAGEFRYAVDVPRAYDGKKPFAVLLDPGHGTGAGKTDQEKADFLPFYRGFCETAGLDDWLVVRTEIVEQIGTGGLRGELPEDEVARAFEAFWRDLASRFAIDPDRLFVTGISQTGFWSWYLGRASADRYAGIAPMSAVTWEVNAYLENFRNLPVFVLHGDQDKICPVEQARATCTKLQQLGFELKYVEIAGAGHDIAAWSRLHEGLTWFAAHPRKKYVHHVSKSLQTLADPWCGFVRVLELETQGDGKAKSRPTASLEASIEGQKVTLTSKGVKQARLHFSRELLDLAQPIEVIWNAKPAFKGKLDRDFETTLSVALERVDWSQIFECAIEARCP